MVGLHNLYWYYGLQLISPPENTTGRPQPATEAFEGYDCDALNTDMCYHKALLKAAQLQRFQQRWTISHNAGKLKVHQMK